MTKMLMQVSSRDKGHYSISMGTSYALEGALGTGPNDKKTNPPPIKEYDAVWINVFTLFRNLLAAIKKEALQTIQPSELLPGLIEDIYGTVYALEKAKHGLRPVFYLNDYRTVTKVYSHAKLKQSITAWQQMMDGLQVETLRLLVASRLEVDVKSFGLKITGDHPKTLMLTHMALDLLNSAAFKKLDLLESFTGEIKPKAKWYTKFTTKEHMERMPFNGFTLQVFGDQSTFFSPQPAKIKKAVIAIAEAQHWTPLTTMEKIKVNVKKYPDTEIREVLLSLL